MFLALQPVLAREWQLTNTMTGWISSAYYGGYMLAVPVLASLTDRLDARSVWLGATALGALAAAGFGLFAHGMWSAVFFQALAGASLAGTYMPGLKLMDDRIEGPLRPRQVAFYTTAFTLGSSGSYFLVGALADRMPWQTAIIAVALGPIAAWLLVSALLDRVRPARDDAYDSSGLEGSADVVRQHALRRRLRLSHVGVIRAPRVADSIPYVLRRPARAGGCIPSNAGGIDCADRDAGQLHRGGIDDQRRSATVNRGGDGVVDSDGTDFRVTGDAAVGGHHSDGGRLPRTRDGGFGSVDGWSGFGLAWQ